MLKFLKKKENKTKEEVRSLLRENLNLLSFDMFLDDPIVDMNPEERKMYLKFFFDLNKEPHLKERIKYAINKQAIKTLENAKDETQDIAGACTINGLAYVLDDINKLSNMYIKEVTEPKEEFNKFDIIPKI